MSEEDQPEDFGSPFGDFGKEFGLDFDPLKQFDEGFKRVGKCPIIMYIEEVVDYQDIAERTKRQKSNKILEWKEFMEPFDRHPACPKTDHCIAFIDSELEKGNTKNTILKKVNHFINMYDYWDDLSKMPHGMGKSQGYNPFRTAKNLRMDKLDSRGNKKQKPQHNISIEEIGHRLRNVKNILIRTFLTTQFKYGTRAGQTSNVKLADVQLEHDELNEVYPQLGTNPWVKKYDGDLIYFASVHERSGGKSKRPQLMPIDPELRNLLVRYLMVRFPNEDSYLFVNDSNGNQLSTKVINRRMWQPVFGDEYEETEHYRKITSHYARHRFTTHWMKDIGINPALAAYMRGDTTGRFSDFDIGSIEDYLHVYFEDVRELYPNNTYYFNI